MILHIKPKNIELIGTRQQNGGCQGLRGVDDEMLVKEYKLSVIK